MRGDYGSAAAGRAGRLAIGAREDAAEGADLLCVGGWTIARQGAMVAPVQPAYALLR